MANFSVHFAGCYLQYSSGLSWLEVQVSVIDDTTVSVVDNGDGTLTLDYLANRPAKCLIDNIDLPSGELCLSFVPNNGTEFITIPTGTTNPLSAVQMPNTFWQGNFHEADIRDGLYYSANLSPFVEWGINGHRHIYITNDPVSFPVSGGVILPSGNINITTDLMTNDLNSSSTSTRAGLWYMRTTLTISGTLSPVFTLDHIEFTDSQTAIVFYTHNGNAGKALYKKGGGVWWPIDNALFGIMKLDQNYNYIRANNSIYNVRMLSQDLGVFDARS